MIGVQLYKSFEVAFFNGGWSSDDTGEFWSEGEYGGKAVSEVLLCLSEAAEISALQRFSGSSVDGLGVLGDSGRWNV